MKLQTFIICASPDSPGLQKKIIEVFGVDDNAYVVRENSQWLVAASMTTRQIYEKIEINSENKPRVAVFLVGNYWGHHSRDLWEWMELD